MPTKARSEELHAAAMHLVTPNVVQELDALLDPDLERDLLTAATNGDAETFQRLSSDPRHETRRVALRALADTLVGLTGCSLATARQYVAKVIRLRRGEAVKADRRGGYRPGAGAPTGNQNWRGKVKAAFVEAGQPASGWEFSAASEPQREKQ
jgi:DNA-binding transcriptional ArsR family regulator